MNHASQQGSIASKPLFRDPIFDGAADPVVIWNAAEGKWWMFYTNRRANVPDLPGVSWVYGSPLGIAESDDGGATWSYRGTAHIPLGEGEGTFWAPDVLFHDGLYHMFLTFVPHIRTDWSGPRRIVHLTSENLLDWEFESTLQLASEKVIDAAVLRLPDGSWRLFYNNEEDRKSIYYADSPDLYEWQDGGKLVDDQEGEGPKVFFWHDCYWMVVDQWRGLAVYRSSDALNWTGQAENILQTPGQGADDGVMGNHADVVVSGERAFLFYFTHPGRRGEDAGKDLFEQRRSSIQVVELKFNDGQIEANRDEPTYIALQPKEAIEQMKPNFLNWAEKPPMGWNSWDCFATTVTEAQTKAQTDIMADKLAHYGWQYVVVDIQWYEPGADSFHYREGAPLVMDEFSRLQPAPNKFPSAENGQGFKALADYVHAKGLKFGIHMMRGISRQAVAQNTPIKGTDVRAADIADTNSICVWNPDMVGVDMSKPGAQDYYDSIFEQLAAWGVDFVKVDDLSRPYHQAEIEAIRKAIDKSGRPMVLSTSPGETPVSAGEHAEKHVNMWRVSDDFWDYWSALFAQFKRLHDWTPYRGAGHFPDADMLPLGAIRQVPGMGGGPWTRFTKDEQLTMMSLWAIARSPLMMGGDLTKNDEWTLSLLTNEEVISVNQNSDANRQLFNRDGSIAWLADVPDSSDKYLALFNTSDTIGQVAVELSELGFNGPVEIRDLWAKKDAGVFTGEFAPEIALHGSGLYRVSAR